MPPKKFFQKQVEDKNKSYSKESSYELYSSEGLSDLESPMLKLSSHAMQTHNVHSHNLKGYKSEHSMNTHLSEDLQVAKEETLHVSLGKVTLWKRPRQKSLKSVAESQSSTQEVKKPKVCGHKRCKKCNYAKQRPKTQDSDVGEAGAEKMSTPKNATSIPKEHVGSTEGNHDTSVNSSIPAENIRTTDETLETSLDTLVVGINDKSTDHIPYTSVDTSLQAEKETFSDGTPDMSLDTFVPAENGKDTYGTPEMSVEKSVQAENDKGANSMAELSEDTSVPTSKDNSQLGMAANAVAATTEATDAHVIDITGSDDEFMHLRKPKVCHTTEKPRKTVQHFQIKQDVPYSTNLKSFKEEQPVSSGVNFSESFNKVFKLSEVLMDDGNQICNYVRSYLNLPSESIRTSVVQYILHNLEEYETFVKNFDFMKTIKVERYASILKGPRVKFDQFSICMLSCALRIHICIFLFKDVWLLSDKLAISDCKLFLGYLGNLTFKYIPISGHLVLFEFSSKDDNRPGNAPEVESEGEFTSFNDETLVVSTPENGKVDSNGTPETLLISGDKRKKTKDGAALNDTIIVGDKHVPPKVCHTPESDVPNYDFDFLNSMSIPERSSEFDQHDIYIF